MYYKPVKVPQNELPLRGVGGMNESVCRNVSKLVSICDCQLLLSCVPADSPAGRQQICHLPGVAAVGHT